MLVMYFSIFLVSVSFGSSPFNAVQILLLNVLLNYSCAFAQISEYPVNNNLPPPLRLASKMQIFSNYMCREIIAQFIYQTLAFAVLLYCGPYFFGIEYQLVVGPLRDPVTGEPENRLVHYSLLLHAFVMLSMANMFNCRRLQTSQFRKALNQFSEFYKNVWLFISILLAAIMLYAGVGFAL